MPPAQSVPAEFAVTRGLAYRQCARQPSRLRELAAVARGPVAQSRAVPSLQVMRSQRIPEIAGSPPNEALRPGGQSMGAGSKKVGMVG